MPGPVSAARCLTVVLAASASLAAPAAQGGCAVPACLTVALSAPAALAAPVTQGGCAVPRPAAMADVSGVLASSAEAPSAVA